ncbi:MAG: phage gp6-like head-tail connector protein [Oscillospiraceae bacterium]|nr:phage gp6-like head-tail connector protein [Oscillospiraceae bacterium]
MKISDITPSMARNYIRAEGDQLQEDILQMALESARTYILDYTGLTETELDAHEDLAVAYLVLTQDIYDQRSLYPDSKYANSGNRTVEIILGMHRRNLL